MVNQGQKQLLWDLVNTFPKFLYNPFFEQTNYYLFEGSLILFNVISFLILIGATVEGEKTQGLLVKMVYVRQVDITYDSVNFDDPISTISYFTRLYLSFALSTEEAEKAIKDLLMRIKESKEGSKESVEVQMQRIMRLAAEKIHGAFRELKQDSVVNTAEFVMLVMNEALKSLIDLMYDGDDDYEDDTPLSKYFQIRNRTIKDVGALKDYEVLG